MRGSQRRRRFVAGEAWIALVVICAGLLLAGCASQSVAGLGLPAAIHSSSASRSAATTGPGTPAPTAARYLLTQQDVPSSYRQKQLPVIPAPSGGAQINQAITPAACRSPVTLPTAATRPRTTFVDQTSGAVLSSTVIDPADGGPYASVSTFRRSTLGTCATVTVAGQTGGKPYTVTQLTTELPLVATGVPQSVAVRRTTLTQLASTPPERDTASIALLETRGAVIQLIATGGPIDTAVLQQAIDATAAKMR